METFPYVLRVVSEITESNGSSSMASVCGASLALMDAGVPILAPVAGVAMGLVKDGDRYQVLTDILGDEDHLGDMDFKVAGSATGVTALQMDIKIDGITREIMENALSQAKEARLHILEQMNRVLPAHREKMSDWAPTIITMKIDPEKIRDVIGKGGSVIRAITEETGASIDIDNDGTVKIASVNATAGREAQARIELITADVEVGRVYEGRVARLMDFGAFVTILPGRDGLVHISQIADERVERVGDKLKEGDIVRVKVLEVDRQGRVRLSMRGHGRRLSPYRLRLLARNRACPLAGTRPSSCTQPTADAADAPFWIPDTPMGRAGVARTLLRARSRRPASSGSRSTAPSRIIPARNSAESSGVPPRWPSAMICRSTGVVISAPVACSTTLTFEPLVISSRRSSRFT